MTQPTYSTLRLILGDQLNLQHPWLQVVDDSVLYVLMELRSETDYATHHIQKVVGIFAAMRTFAEAIKAQGHHVRYIPINEPTNQQRFDENCRQLLLQHQCTHFAYQQPDEYRVDEHLKAFAQSLSIAHSVADTHHFYTTRTELGQLFAGKKTFLMETFYRHMRIKHHLMVDADNKPWQGQWNFDADNRKKLPAGHRPVAPLMFTNDVSTLCNELNIAKITTIGTIHPERFIWPISREQSLELLSYFIQHCLQWFGTFQDAMAPQEWSIYHTRLSFSLNVKMLSPKEVVNAAIEAYTSQQFNIAYHQLEGFVRQILGWREYMRGIYWHHMPGYAQLNYLGHSAPLPSWYWTGATKMNCMKQAITQSLTYAYAHHIQRLMVTGNFALLAGVHPDAIDAWYLGIYIDAFEWVEITNTRGMSQYADGGIVGTKPYVSSAAYIHKMSSYCTGCYYDAAKKVGDRACPFNSLYWHFYHRHEATLRSNPRIGMMYTIWHKMKPEAQTALLAQAQWYLEHMEEV